ncbi:MAG: zf-HC2 domain-containing protein [candidate division NC10 bacterium]|nr:zf-HC2 domain-containing protein [candidate division NC10 bacterium]
MTEHLGELLTGYLDAALTAEERTRVEDHLAACGVCRANLEELRRNAAAVGNLPELPVAPDFAGRVTARLPRPGLAQTLAGLLGAGGRRLPLAAAAALLLAVGAAYLASRLTTPAPLPVAQGPPAASRQDVDRPEPRQERERAVAKAPAPRELAAKAGVPIREFRVAAEDLVAAEAHLRELAAALGGRVVAGEREEGGVTLGVEVPAGRYREFVEGLQTVARRDLKEAGRREQAAPPSAAAPQTLPAPEGEVSATAPVRLTVRLRPALPGRPAP